jgi:type I restriction enzyme R subunit
MNDVGKPERETQRRVIALFRDELGYRFHGDWTDRDGNSNIEEKLLTDYLRDKGGYSPAQISSAIYKLTTEANNSHRGLYGNNHAVYNLLRYGVPVKVEAGKPTETVHLINWKQPEENDFAIAEEVTLKGGHERRPDLVLYVNGIGVDVIEKILRGHQSGAMVDGLWEGPLRTLANPRAPPKRGTRPDGDEPRELQLVLDPEFL